MYELFVFIILLIFVSCKVNKNSFVEVKLVLMKHGSSKNRIAVEDAKNKQPNDYTGLGRENRRVEIVFTKIE